jgi:NADH-quinone oxidoreductase subunit E
MRASSHRAGEPGVFAFTPETMEQAKQVIERYPEGRQASATIALLDLAQRQNGGWLPGEAIEYVANLLEIAPIRVHEVASFYSMYNSKPVGTHFIQVCRTTPCWLRGSDGITQACLDTLGIGLGATTEDGQFTVVEVECLGACANAPMVQINDDYYEDLTPERMAEMIGDLKDGKPVPTGPQTGRQGSCPSGGPTTLLDSSQSNGGQPVDSEGSD